jgi:putative serine protease PepD
MKKAIVLALLALVFAPYTADAAWWNPFTWKRPVSSITSASSTADNASSSTSASVSSVDPLALPTTDDLYKRIAELELKLDRTRADLEKARSASSKVSSGTGSSPSSVAPALASSDVLTKVKPALVLVEGSAGTASGAFIDSEGRVLVNSHILGSSREANVTISNGTKKKATLVGVEEVNDIAVLQVSDKKSSSYLTLNYGAGLTAGDTVYLASVVGPKTIGSAFVVATVSSKESGLIQVTSVDKPIDNGGVLVTARGSLVGIPSPSTCKVLEDMKTCLKYGVTTNVYPSRIPLLVQGMKLFKDNKNRTSEEILFRGYLDGVYKNINQADTVKFAINSVTGKNSFDYFNSKLIDDTEGKIAKFYILKLKSAAQNTVQGFDFLKSISYSFRVSLINDSALLLNLDDYQQKTMEKVRLDNEARLKLYQTQIDLWTKKKNEYDAYIAKPEEITHDYLMAESAEVEAAVDRLSKERQNILDGLTNDVRGIF